MTKYNIISCFYCLTIISCGIKEKPNQDCTNYQVELVENGKAYCIQNYCVESIFIPISYYPIELSVDSILFESYPHYDLLNHLQFMLPKTRELRQGSEISKNLNIVYDSSKKYYFRVFDEDIDFYFKKNKIASNSKTNFRTFEKDHSYLIQAK